MATSDPRARIMAHMNRDHTAELSMYLRAFNGLSASAAAGARLTGLSLDALTVESASGVHTVRVSPPMGSLADARVRMVDMAARARSSLGLSDVRVDRFVRPRGGGLASFLGVGFYFASALALALGLLRPGTAAWALLDRHFPAGSGGGGGAATFAWLVRRLFVPVVLIHTAEAWWMARSRLARHGVEAGSALWFKWVLETFVEGYPAFRRFDGLVREERAKKDAAKH
ncbi:hypothetical protein F4802DRAFT_599065 [Xylaria palmicola]|nr:hypothetical protein F4802DRAFT_599065 [Xylaria palmicola]